MMSLSRKAGSTAGAAVDPIQNQLARYAAKLSYDDLPVEVVQAAKLRIIDTLGALIGGYFGEPCRIARTIAASNPNPCGATVLGTRIKTSVDLAAFANATAARYLEYTDFYHWPGALDGHASDVLTSAFATAEHAKASGRDLITGVVLGYEAFLRLCDVFPNGGFDYTNCSVLGSAVSAGKLLNLTSAELEHCISLAVVPNVILKQVRREGKTGFKPTASGHAGRAGVFAALLAKAGMDGPNLPFAGQFGFSKHVLGKSFTLDTLGGEGDQFKILRSQIKIRPSERNTVPLIMAAEKIAPLPRQDKVRHIGVEVYKKAIDEVGTKAEIWEPQTREAAYHSIPYIVAAALIEGSITLRSFDENHLRNQQIRAMMKKIELSENEDFTAAFHAHPVEHRARITITYEDGETLIAEVGGQHEQSADTDAVQIAGKFRSMTEDVLGKKKVESILETLMHLDEVPDVSALSEAFVI